MKKCGLKSINLLFYEHLSLCRKSCCIFIDFADEKLVITQYSNKCLTVWSDLELKDMLVNVSDLVSEVAYNLSVPVDSLNALLSSRLNLTEV